MRAARNGHGRLWECSKGFRNAPNVPNLETLEMSFVSTLRRNKWQIPGLGVFLPGKQSLGSALSLPSFQEEMPALLWIWVFLEVVFILRSLAPAGFGVLCFPAGEFSQMIPVGKLSLFWEYRKKHGGGGAESYNTQECARKQGINHNKRP